MHADDPREQGLVLQEIEADLPGFRQSFGLVEELEDVFKATGNGGVPAGRMGRSGSVPGAQSAGFCLAWG